MPSTDDARPTRRRLLGAVAALAATTGVSGCVISAEPYTETADRTFDPGDAEELVVRTDSGDVTLSAGDGDAVSGTVRKESRSGEEALDEVTVEGSVADGTLTVAVDRPGDRNVTVSLDLEVPDGLAVVEAAAENGDVTGEGVAGDGTYRTRTATRPRRTSTVSSPSRRRTATPPPAASRVSTARGRSTATSPSTSRPCATT